MTDRDYLLQMGNFRHSVDTSDVNLVISLNYSARLDNSVPTMADIRAAKVVVIVIAGSSFLQCQKSTLESQSRTYLTEPVAAYTVARKICIEAKNHDEVTARLTDLSRLEDACKTSGASWHNSKPSGLSFPQDAVEKKIFWDRMQFSSIK